MRPVRLATATVFAALFSVCAVAHHSFVAGFDPDKPRTITGTVTKLEWTNPHARFYVDVKNAKGTITSYEVELGSPNKLLRYGWNRNAMKAGDVVTVEGFDSRDGTPLLNAKTVKFADGRAISGGSSLDTGP